MKKASEFLIKIGFAILPLAIFNAIFGPTGLDQNPLIARLELIFLLSYPIVVLIALLLSKKFQKEEKYKASFWISIICFMPGILLLILSFIVVLVLFARFTLTK